MTSLSHVDRALLPVVADRLRDEPVIALQGARSVGKSTLLRDLATRAGASVVDLDDPAVRSAAAQDPGIFVAGEGLVCIDEYQHVPEILDAIKAELNRDLRPGRFLLTGSTRYEALPRAAQSLAGRLHLMTIRPLSQTELTGQNVNLVQDLLTGHTAGSILSTTTRADYAARITTGGMPLALARTGAARTRWFADYIGAALQRNALELANLRQPEALADLFRTLSAQTAQVLNISNAASRLGMSERTANNYVHVLENLFLLFQLPAWTVVARARAAKQPKIHMLDSGLCTHALGLTPARLTAATPSALTSFGHLLESFVVGELLSQASNLDGIAATGYWRTRDGDEVDLIIESDEGVVLAVEVKASSQVRPADLKSLRSFRAKAEGFEVRPVAFYLGERAYRTSDGVDVLPVDRLWLG